MRGLVEGRLGFPSRALLAQHHQDTSFRRELDYGVIADVGHPDVIITVHCQPMRTAYDTVAPGAKEGPICRKTHDGMGATMVDIDVVFGIDTYHNRVSKLPL